MTDSNEQDFSGVPNLHWLIMGVIGGTLLFLKQHLNHQPRMPLGFGIYIGVGLLISCVWAVFENPKPVENGFGISILIPIHAAFWPFLLLFLVTNKPWNSPKWKTRHEKPTDNSTQNPQDDP